VFRGKVIVLAAAVILTVTSVASARATPAQSAAPSPTKNRPLLEVDLHKFAGANWNVSNDDKAEATSRSAIEFADNTSLIWEWTTRDNQPPPVKKDAPVHLRPAHRHAVLLDAINGHEKATQDFYVPMYSAYFRIVRDGRYLTCIDNKIRLFSPEFELLREVPLAPPFVCAGSAYFSGGGISPSGRSVLVSSISVQEGPSEILDTDTLKAVSTANEGKLVTITSISDHWLVGLCGNPWEVCVRTLDGSWQAFSFTGPEYQTRTSVLGRAYFVNDDTILICRLSEMSVANVNGSVLFRANLPKDRSCENSLPAVASEGGRFAMMEKERLRSNEFLDVGTFWTDDEILVYDVSERRAIFTVKVKGVSPWPSSIKHYNEFALSPDGTRLAVVSDGILKIYELPARLALP
jgi:hypothetical protein